MNIRKQFSEDLKKFESAPFLFIGSGFSRRYIGLENWKNFLKKFCIQEIAEFNYYLSKSDSYLPNTATLMANDFHEVWWKNDRYKKTREEYKNIGEIDHKDSPIKFEISEYLKNKSISDLDEKFQKEIDHFKQIVVDGIITTNWDLLIEELFPDYDVYIGQKDLLNSTLHEIGEIYKIHGSVLDFNSLILTDEDYEDFNRKYEYLAAKLLTIFIEHPIIFIGYSISDQNVQEILNSISNCVSESGLKKLKNNIFFVEPIYDDSTDIYENSMISIEGNNLPITSIKAKNYSNIYKPLTEYKRKFSVKQLNKIKTQIYEIIKMNDPNGRISTLDLDDSTENEDIEFVIGVGVQDKISKQGYLGITYDDVLEDIVLDNKSYDPEIMVESALSQVLKTSIYTPYYKYLEQGNFLDTNGELIREVSFRVKRYLNHDGSRFRTQNCNNMYNNDNFKNYEYTINPDVLMANILRNGVTDIDIGRLGQLLEENINVLNENYSGDINLSRYRKMIRIYDWLKYYCLN